jgi:hypothetical protein
LLVTLAYLWDKKNGQCLRTDHLYLLV